MSPPAAARAGRARRLGCGGLAVVLTAVVAGAEPAAAHTGGGGSLPAPPWLLSYLGAAALAATAVALRATWGTARLQGFVTPADAPTGAPGAADVAGAASRRRTRGLHVGNLAGLALFAVVLAAAVIGPDSGAANVAPVAVLVVWWVGLPLACLLLGDVMRAINPFMPLVGLLRRHEGDATTAPAWTSAAFLAAFAWFFVAYHRPGSARALAVLLVLYAAAAVAGGVRWGRGWLATGEAFGALSSAVALLSPRRRHAQVPPGLGALMVVWIGSTAFDAFASTPFWIDILGTSVGWTRTMLNTVGFVWVTAIVGGTYLLAVRVAERAQPEPRDAPSLSGPLAVALIPLALGWFLAHDLTLLLSDGQNFLVLISDPVGKGWDLFGTFDRTIDFGILQATWVQWTQVGLLAAGHATAVVVAHDTALALLRRRPAMAVTWAMTAAAVASLVAGALMVFG